MQTLVSAVRATGANNVIMLGGLEYANDLTQWLAYKPTDPDHNLVASWHSYNFNTCSTQSCWTSQIAPVLAQVPVVSGEIGENDCAGTYINSADDLAGLAGRQLPCLGVERGLQLLQRPRPDHRLRGGRDRLRCRVPGAPGDPGRRLAPISSSFSRNTWHVPPHQRKQREPAGAAGLALDPLAGRPGTFTAGRWPQAIRHGQLPMPTWYPDTVTLGRASPPPDTVPRGRVIPPTRPRGGYLADEEQTCGPASTRVFPAGPAGWRQAWPPRRWRPAPGRPLPPPPVPAASGPPRRSP